MYAVLCVCVFGCTVVCARVGGFLSYCVQVCRVCAMHECMYVCGRGICMCYYSPWVCVYVCMCINMYKCVSLRTCEDMCEYMCMCMLVITCVSVLCMSVCVCICMYVCICMCYSGSTGVAFTEVSNPIRIRIRRVPISQPTRTPTHEMIQRSYLFMQ